MTSKKPKRGGGAAHQRMVDGVLPAVGAAVAGVVDQLALILRMRIGDDVVVLEIVGGGADRQVVVDVQLLAEDAAHLAQEVRASYQSPTLRRRSSGTSDRSSSSKPARNSRAASIVIFAVASWLSSLRMVRK